jgi:hypothetical protein
MLHFEFSLSAVMTVAMLPPFLFRLRRTFIIHHM